jgi:hypothetical protein
MELTKALGAGALIFGVKRGDAAGLVERPRKGHSRESAREVLRGLGGGPKDGVLRSARFVQS